MNAIEVARQDDRVKAVYTFDPWLYAVTEDIEIDNYAINQPQVHVLSDGFSPVIQDFFDYDTEEVLQKMIDNSTTNKKESIILKEINHYHQCDAILLVPMESFIKSCNMWQCNVGELYLLNS